MKSINITSTFTIYDGVSELPKTVQKLMQKAITARDNAYAHYSNVIVGAAVLLDNGKIIL